MASSGRVTLEDVAREAHVSRSSVSNVVRNQPHVREAVRERVREAINKLGYRPLAIGQNLVSGRTGVVSLAIPNFAQPYFAEIARNAVAAATANGLRLAVEQTDNDLEREREIAGAWNLGTADGLIFSPSAISDEEIEELRAGTPLVLLGERSKLSTVDRVGIDSVAIARLATEHLIAQGCRQIVMIGHKSFGDKFVVSERVQGFHEALAAHGLHEATSPREVQDWTRRDGVTAMEGLIASGIPFDAVFCANDLVAIGAITALHSHGYQVPQKVAVIGVDDIEEATFSQPSLSTVFIDRVWMVETAFELLSKRLREPDARPRQVTVPHHLAVRGSTMR